MKKVISIIILGFLFLAGCSNTAETKEIVLYLEEHSEDWIKSDESYEEVKADRIDAFNERLKEMNVDLKLTVKTFPRCEGSCNELAENIKNHDKNVDIIAFNQAYIADLLPLNTYYETKEGKSYLDMMSENRVKTMKVNNDLYLFPKMLYPLITSNVGIEPTYYERHKEEIDDNKNSGKELLEYFRDNYEEDSDWLLANNLNLDTFIGDSYQSIPNTPFFIRRSDGIIVNPYDETYIKDVMRIMAEIRWNGFTGKNLTNDEQQEIIEKGNVVLTSGAGLSARIARKDDRVRFDIGEEYYSYTSGFSILKSSEHAEEAFQLLLIMNTDKKSSEILQFGVNPVRNTEGKIVDDSHTLAGSWNNLGNNLIIESAENEVENKKEYFKEMEETSPIYNGVLFPSFFDLSTVAIKLNSFHEIMLDSFACDTSVTACLACVTTGPIQDPDEFMKEIEKVNQNLKDAGIDKVIAELQKQLDGWKKNET